MVYANFTIMYKFHIETNIISKFNSLIGNKNRNLKKTDVHDWGKIYF